MKRIENQTITLSITFAAGLCAAMVGAACGDGESVDAVDPADVFATSARGLIPPPGGQATIDFEGLAVGETVGAQYAASLGVTFSGGFKACARSYFGFLAAPFSDRLLCTWASASQDPLLAPPGAASVLVASFSYPVDEASIEFRTGIPPTVDGDLITLTARNAAGVVIAQRNCTASNNGLPTEAVATCSIFAPDMRSLEIDDGDADSLDTLWLRRKCEPLLIDFDSSPAGTLAHRARLAEQYAAWGVHFGNANNVFYVARRTLGFPPYVQGPLTLNMICTHAGSSGDPDCRAPIGPNQRPARARLFVNFDYPIYGAQIEGRTTMGFYDADMVTMEAYSGVGGTGALVATSNDTANNNPSPYSVEGVMYPDIHLTTASIRSVVIDDVDSDALDSLYVYTCN